MNGYNLKSRLLASSVFAGAAFGLISMPAVAQDADEEARQETVTVTGSRIERLDFVSNSPVATVGSEQFDITGTVNTESLLNTLPQTVPGLDRTSNNPGNGTATVDLRGLGANRTLVLVDGRRFMGTDSDGVVDINNIPPALVERVEVLTGGASAVYGADAISGVVNFILKDDFEGVEVSAGYETTQEGDASLWSTSLTAGGNFAEGRGNAVLSLTYANREELFQGDRDFADTALFDNAAGDGLEPGGSSGVPQLGIFAGFDFPDGSSGAGIFNEDGSIRPFITGGDVNDFYNYAPVNYIQLPQERFTGTGLASYDIAEDVEVYTRFTFANNDVPQQLAPTPAFQTAEFSLDGNPFITPDAQQIISDAIGLGVDTDGDGIDDTASFLLRRRLEEVGPRRVESGFNAFQFVAGVRGDISPNLNYDVSFQEGRVETSFSQAGNVSVSNFRQSLLLADADGDGNVDLNAAGQPTGCADPSNGCVPLNLYGEGNISEDAAQFLRILVNADADVTQTVFSAYLSGDTAGAIELPGGPIGFALGGEYREEDFDFRPSQDLATGNIAGFNGQPPASGGYDVYDFYVEALLPFLKDAPFAEELSAEVAYRYSDYSSIGATDTYKVAGRWAPDEQIAFRASYNRAVRAPNIGELFSPQGEGFPGATDPCAGNGDQVGNADVRAICLATGVPEAAVFTDLINPASGQVRALSGGNPDLDAEEADTYTIGAVYQPNFVDGLQVSLDYFDIEITGAIAAFGGGANNVLDVCYTEADGGVGSTFCNVINRRSDGTIDFISLTAQNAAFQTKKGFDLLVDYGFDTDYGRVDLDYVATLTTEDEFQSEGGPLIACEGQFGSECGEPIPEFKHRAAARWNNGPLTAQLTWRYVGEVEDDPVFFVDTIDAVNYFDLSGTYEVNDNLSLTGGIDNLLDEEPPIIGDNDEQSNTYPATYDVFGRTFFVRATARF
ncbi:MAG: TonB-dependent receptor [Pseudomonadota bacterium]